MIQFQKVLVFLCVTLLLFYMIRLLLFTNRKWPLKSYTFGILIGGMSLISIACFFDIIENVYRYKFIQYIIKTSFTLGAIIYVAGVILWSRFTKTMMEKLEKTTLTDPMTGVLNRSGVEKIYYELTEDKKPFYVIVCDLNGTKVINDTYGHIAGDKYISEATKILSNEVGTKGHISRIGGDEFVILLNYMDEEKVEVMISNIKRLVSSIYLDKNSGISIGYSLFPIEGRTLKELIKAADEKMYEDKKQSKVCV